MRISHVMALSLVFAGPAISMGCSTPITGDDLDTAEDSGETDEYESARVRRPDMGWRTRVRYHRQ